MDKRKIPAPAGNKIPIVSPVASHYTELSQPTAIKN